MAVRHVLQAFENNLKRLNELGTCDVERRDFDGNYGDQPSLCHEIIQVQLLFWTLVLSVVYSYAWKQHRKKFILCIFFVVPFCFFVCCLISYILFVLVVLGHIISSDFCKNFFDAEETPIPVGHCRRASSLSIRSLPVQPSSPLLRRRRRRSTDRRNGFVAGTWSSLDQYSSLSESSDSLSINGAIW